MWIHKPNAYTTQASLGIIAQRQQQKTVQREEKGQAVKRGAQGLVFLGEKDCYLTTSSIFFLFFLSCFSFYFLPSFTGQMLVYLSQLGFYESGASSHCRPSQKGKFGRRYGWSSAAANQKPSFTPRCCNSPWKAWAKC
jgi:hypothetical protein